MENEPPPARARQRKTRKVLLDLLPPCLERQTKRVSSRGFKLQLPCCLQLLCSILDEIPAISHRNYWQLRRRFGVTLERYSMVRPCRVTPNRRRKIQVSGVRGYSVETAAAWRPCNSVDTATHFGFVYASDRIASHRRRPPSFTSATHEEVWPAHKRPALRWPGAYTWRARQGLPEHRLASAARIRPASAAPPIEPTRQTDRDSP